MKKNAITLENVGTVLNKVIATGHSTIDDLDGDLQILHLGYGNLAIAFSGFAQAEDFCPEGYTVHVFARGKNAKTWTDEGSSEYGPRKVTAEDFAREDPIQKYEVIREMSAGQLKKRIAAIIDETSGKPDFDLAPGYIREIMRAYQELQECDTENYECVLMTDDEFSQTLEGAYWENFTIGDTQYCYGILPD